MHSKRSKLAVIVVAILLGVALWAMKPAPRHAAVDLGALEAQELLQQYSYKQVEGGWPQPAAIQTKLLQFTSTSTAADGARVDFYRMTDRNDTRKVHVQLYPDGRLSRVEMSPAS